MKKHFFIALILITAFLSAEEKLINISDHNLLLGPSIGWLNGVGEETVYRDEKTNDKLSQLLWEMNPLFYIGFDVNYNWQKPENGWGIFADTLFKFGFPNKTGVMEDRDWVAQSYPDFLTHYSVHDSSTEKAVLIDANIGASFKILNQFLLKTYVSYSYMSFLWMAVGGSLLYPAGDGGHMYSVIPIEVGNYKQVWNIISPAVAFYGEFNPYFNIEASFKFSPFIWCATEDNHLLRNLVITENTAWGFFVEPGLVFTFTPKVLLSLSLSLSYRNISGVRGDGNYDEQGKPSFTAKNMLGAGYSAFDVGLVAKIGIF